MLDGKYEITLEQELGERVTRFGATAPDGTALNIVWYDLATPADERAFEQYRTLLRQLRRGGHAAVFDLVSRPGAHYVAWRLPEEAGAHPVVVGAEPETELGAIAAVLAAQGRNLGDAHLCAAAGEPPQVYGLAFSTSPAAESVNLGAPTALDPTLPASPKPAQGRRWLSVAGGVWARFRPWAPASLLGLLGIFFLLLSLGKLLQSSLVTVPDVQGRNINAALTVLQHAGFQGAPVALTSSRPAGEVLEVQPPAGTPLRPGRTLSVRYALPAGSAPEASPEVVGVSLAQAETTLRSAGFRVAEVARSYSRAPRGTVLAQSPDALSPAARGSRFALLVSDGPLGELTFLPDLTGLTQDDALSLAEAAGFARRAVKLELTPGNGTPAGTVLAQNIAPYVKVPLGEAQLRLVVAAPSGGLADESGTPDLTGLDLGSAQQQARTLGLSVVATAQVSAPELPSGIVLQQPEPGTPLRGTVRVTLNRAPLGVPIPQVSVNVEPSAPAEATVRRARYVWQLGQDAGGRTATITVALADGTQETVLRGQLVSANERLEGTYLTTATGPLVFTLTLDGQPYGAPLTVQ